MKDLITVWEPEKDLPALDIQGILSSENRLDLLEERIKCLERKKKRRIYIKKIEW